MTARRAAGAPSVGIPQHRRRDGAHDRDRCAASPRATSRSGSVRPPRSSAVTSDGPVAAQDAAPAQLALDPVDLAAREPRVRRPQVRVELRPLAVEPGEAEQRRAATGRTASRGATTRPRARRDAERGERGLEREADRVERTGRRPRSPPARCRRGSRRAPPRRRARACPRSRALEEADRAVELARGGSPRTARARDARARAAGTRRPRRELDDRVTRQRGEVCRRPRERGVDRAARLVRQRDVDVGARGERLEEAPLRARQVLEAVREHRAVPHGELARQALDRAASKRAAVPGAEPLELVAVGPGEARRAARRGRPARAARRRARRGPAEASAKPGPARRGCRRLDVDRGAGRRALGSPSADVASAVRRGRASRTACRRCRSVPASRPPQRRTSSRSTRSTSARFGTISHGSRSIASTNRSSKERDLAGMRRTDDEGETHRCMVVGRLSRPGLRRRKDAPSEESGGSSGRDPSPRRVRSAAQASDFGLRPRRATACPGIPPAQESQRSACFAPRRASLNVTRRTAPFPSPTSVPHVSQTRTVFLATIPPTANIASAISARRSSPV